jgi:hypothetical protein
MMSSIGIENFRKTKHLSMIKFFRRIRQRLLSENRLGKYLLYAIGEIVLVMIGILLALQVNNWNEERKREAQEIKMLKELVVNLRADSVDNAINQSFYMRISTSAERVLQELEAKSPWNDSMKVHYGRLLNHGLATLNTSAYDNLKSIGFDLIQNDSIRIALTNLHSITYTQIAKFEQELAADNQTMVITPVILKRVRFIKAWSEGEPIDHQALMDDTEFIEIVRWKAITSWYVSVFHKRAIRESGMLIRRIKRELENRNFK